MAKEEEKNKKKGKKRNYVIIFYFLSPSVEVATKKDEEKVWSGWGARRSGGRGDG